MAKRKAIPVASNLALGALVGPLEARALAVVAERGEATVGDVHGALRRERDLAYTTVMTILSRLASKGVLVRVKQGRRFVYSTAQTPSNDAARRMRQLMSGLITTFGGVAIRSFVESASEVDDSTLQQLEQELARARARGTRK